MRMAFAGVIRDVTAYNWTAYIIRYRLTIISEISGSIKSSPLICHKWILHGPNLKALSHSQDSAGKWQLTFSATSYTYYSVWTLLTSQQAFCQERGRKYAINNYTYLRDLGLHTVCETKRFSYWRVVIWFQVTNNTCCTWQAARRLYHIIRRPTISV